MEEYLPVELHPLKLDYTHELYYSLSVKNFPPLIKNEIKQMNCINKAWNKKCSSITNL
jgi:hypothetical protein